MDNYILHSGVGHDDDPPGRGSGRFGWGTGDNPYQHAQYSWQYYQQMRSKGLTDAQIAETCGMGVGELRDWASIDRNHEAIVKIEKALDLYSKYDGNTTRVAKEMGVNESTVRGWLRPEALANRKVLDEKADYIKAQLEYNGGGKKYIDVGRGVENELGITESKKKTILQMLKKEGYVVFNDLRVNQAATNHRTILNVLAPPGTTYADILKDMSQIKPLADYEGTEEFTNEGLKEPVSISRDRILVRYGEEGGEERDGTIELRRGVDDISLGDAKYSQVRIRVDGNMYMKGMAFYSDNIPKGYDIIYNSNKPIGTPDLAKIGDSVFKKLKDDPENPFGSAVRPSVRNPETGLLEGGQHEYIDSNGEVKLSAINKLSQEGDWDEWSKTLSSQFLSKQEVPLIRRQLNYSIEERKNELEDIESIKQPTIRKLFLKDFGEDCDKAAAYLKAESLPRQSSKVILPVDSLKDNEIYAPTYRAGEHVVLIRHPHAGPFEIPELIVTDKNPEAKSIIGPDATDAVGINKNVAAKLSGADFDGDTVVVIPVNDNVRVKTMPTLAGLEGFSPNEYAIDRTVVSEKKLPRMTEAYKQKQMGVVSNLITDMQIKGANPNELAAAVRHSMVVIDAVKHDLDFRQSEKDNSIKELKEKYQDNGDGKHGASTILSRAKSEVRVNERRDTYSINPETGEKIYKETGRTIKEFLKNEDGSFVKDASGKAIRVDTGTKATQKVHAMDEVDDAFKLTSGGSKENPGHLKEALYANYANSLKAMANTARKEYASTKDESYRKLAEDTYKEEVASIKNKLNTAQLNAPRERQANIVANTIIAAKKRDNPNLKTDKDKMKKVRTSVINTARANLGAKKEPVVLTAKEWEAIEAGALKKSTIEELFKNADKDKLRKVAMSTNTTKSFTSSQKSLIKSMKESGYPLSDIADRFNVSPSTISKILKES